MTTTAAIDAVGLVKSFGQLRAVDGIDLDVRQMLATLLPIDAGQARVFGVDVARDPHRIRQQRLRPIARDRFPPPAHIGEQVQGDGHPVSLRIRRAR